jgi:hypothetical protein
MTNVLGAIDFRCALISIAQDYISVPQNVPLALVDQTKIPIHFLTAMQKQLDHLYI